MVVSVLKISLIIACIIGVIAYRLAVFAAFASIIEDNRSTNLGVVGPLITPQLATSVTASCINFVIIMILNLMYERVAIWITDMGEGQSETANPRLLSLYLTIMYLIMILEIVLEICSFSGLCFKSNLLFPCIGRNSQDSPGV